MLGRPHYEINRQFEIRATERDLIEQALYDLHFAAEIENLFEVCNNLVNEDMVKRLK